MAACLNVWSGLFPSGVCSPVFNTLFINVVTLHPARLVPLYLDGWLFFFGMYIRIVIINKILLYPVYTIKLTRRAGYMLAGRASSMFAPSCKRGISELNWTERKLSRYTTNSPSAIGKSNIGLPGWGWSASAFTYRVGQKWHHFCMPHNLAKY